MNVLPQLRFWLAVGVVGGLGLGMARADEGAPPRGGEYRRPPQVLEELALAPHPLSLVVDASGRRVLVAEPADIVPLAQLTWPERRLYNLRYYPEASAAVRDADYAALGVCSVPVPGDVWEGSRCRWFERPADGSRLRHPLFSPDGSRLIFAELHREGLELRQVDLATPSGSVRPVAPVRLYDVLGAPCTFFPASPSGDDSLLCRVARPAPPAGTSPEPQGPVLRDSAAPALAEADSIDPRALLSSVVRVGLDGRVESLVEEGPWRRVELSPDGQRVLLERLGTTPDRFEVRSLTAASDGSAAIVRPLATRRGDPHEVTWRDDAPATLSWLEAETDVPGEVTDRLWCWPAPFEAAPRVLFSSKEMLERTRWGGGDLALVETRAAASSTRRRWAMDPSRSPERPPVLLATWSASLEDPAVPLTRPAAAGHEVVERSEDGRLWVRGGAAVGGPGDLPRPTLALQDPATGELEVRWRSPEGVYSRPVAVVGDAAGSGPRFLVAREAEGEPANLEVVSSGSPPRSVTGWTHPAPLLATARHQRLEYRRTDGLELTASLYLPPSHGTSEVPLPMIFWAYPQSFESRDLARRSARPEARSLRAEPLSPLLWLSRGYAVLEPDMPIVASPGGSANDRWREQLVADAEAAVAAAVATGTVDPGRIAVLGHSYGAHMAVALLAHTDLFRTGVAMAGAYNRTLTPFGFQEEPRSLWQAPEVYRRLSPFLDADRISEPLLLIHGLEDSQQATRPEQSERLFEALSFLGRPARLVLLPHEGHRPRGRESVLHLLWEVDRWLGLYLAPSADP
ncbi:MAG: S9 family peptidase [Acidobacteria bacterium]|nr:S9 family peptidase [Acidobacteriota bacterium]